MVYPTLLAAIGDVVDPLVRASSVGVYRLWRDSGYAFGALLSGIVAQALGQNAAIRSSRAHARIRRRRRRSHARDASFDISVFRPSVPS